MLNGLISAEDEEEIMKELDELREQEVKTVLKREYTTKVVNQFYITD